MGLVWSRTRQPFGLNGLATLGSTQPSPLCDVAVWVWWTTKAYLWVQNCENQHKILPYMCECRNDNTGLHVMPQSSDLRWSLDPVYVCPASHSYFELGSLGMHSLLLRAKGQ